MTWLIVGIAIVAFIGFISQRTESKTNMHKLSRLPDPQEDRDYVIGDMGDTVYLTVNSIGGYWSDPEVGWRDIEETLEKYGFQGFDGYEEVDTGGADITWPEDQIKAADALNKFANSFPQCESLPLSNGKHIFKSDIIKLAHIFQSGRTIIPW